MWVTEGPKTDPGAGTVLADTGALSIGVTATIIVTGNAYFTFEIAKRNAANNADVTGMVHPIPFTSTPLLFMASIPFTFTLGQRLVIRCQDDVVGTLQASIMW